MKKLLFAGLAIGALIAPAMAADMPVKAPPPPLFSWTGFYIGANAGFGTIRDEALPYCITPLHVVMGVGCTDVFGGRVRGDGFLGGGQAGYNWQVGHWVLGVETDIQGGDVKGTDVVTGPFQVVGVKPLTPASYTTSEKLSWLGTTRGRLGLAFDRVLIYATGGVAYGEASVNQNLAGSGIQFPSSASATMTGWTAGGGLEYAFAGNWSAKFEGMFYNLGTITTAAAAVPHVNTFGEVKTFNVEGAVARVGVNWRFGGLGWY